MSTCQRPQMTQKGQSCRESKYLPPSLWSAVMAKLRQPERVQANGLAQEVDGGVSTITDSEIALREVALETRGAETQLTGYSPNQF
jgi:hypothetical protein